MRTVSFVERIEVEFHGNVISQAMVLADVDNDMANELVVGNIDGQIGIFKGDSPQAWKKASVAGMLTCLAVGTIHDSVKNSLICMTAEGWCYMYDVTTADHSQHTNASESEDCDHCMIKPVFTQELPANARVMCLADIDSDGQTEMVIGYSDRVVMAFRWVEASQGDMGQFVLLQKWQLAGQIGSITINYNRDHQPELMVSQPGATFVTLQVKPAFRHIKSESSLEKLDNRNPAKQPLERSSSFAAPGDALVGTPKTRLLQQQSFPFTGSDPSYSGLSASSKALDSNPSISGKQSETTSTQQDRMGPLHKSLDLSTLKSAAASGASANVSQGENNPSKVQIRKTNSLRGCKSESSSDNGGEASSKPSLVSSMERLDGGSLVKFGDSPQDGNESWLDQSQSRLSQILDGSFDDDVFKPSIIYHPLAHMQTRNKDTSTVIVGGINRGTEPQSRDSSGGSEPQPAATYYALATLDGSLILVENDSILWSLQVDHYLFALSKLDVTGNGKEEVVCCSWNGQTYIVNHSKEIVRYHFPDSVAAFCAGYFSLGPHNNAPCFVYATFNNRLYIYPNITLPRVESTDLLRVMARRKETAGLLKKLNIEENDVESTRQLYHWCLYGQHAKSS